MSSLTPSGIAPGGYVISVARAQSTNVPASQVPMVTIKTHINVRQGPGTNYPVIDTAAPGEQYVVTARALVWATGGRSVIRVVPRGFTLPW